MTDAAQPHAEAPNGDGSRVDVTVRACDEQGDIAHADAMTLADTERFLAAGRAVGVGVAAGGLVAIGEIGIGNTTVAAALAVALLGLDVNAAVGLGSGADSAMLARKRNVVTTAIGRWQRAEGRTDPLGILATLGGPEFAVLTGVVLGAAGARAAIVLDGLATGVCALLAVRLEPAAAAHLIAGQRSRERAHAAVLTELGCEPLLDLRFRAGEGAGAALATGLLLDGLAVRRTTAEVAY